MPCHPAEEAHHGQKTTQKTPAGAATTPLNTKNKARLRYTREEATIAEKVTQKRFARAMRE